MPSSVIRKWNYDESERQLNVLFVSGRSYCYYDVPLEIAEEMRAAFSKGRFFNRRIRDHFAFTEH